MQDHLRRRHRAERRFRRAGAVAIGSRCSGSRRCSRASPRTAGRRFRHRDPARRVFDPALFEGVAEAPPGERDALIAGADYAALVRNALRALFPRSRAAGAARARGARELGCARRAARGGRARPALIGATRAFWLPPTTRSISIARAHLARRVGGRSQSQRRAAQPGSIGSPSRQAAHRVRDALPRLGRLARSRAAASGARGRLVLTLSVTLWLVFRSRVGGRLLEESRRATV
jgi:hypothetical protein